MDKVVLINKRTGKKTLMSKSKAIAIMNNPVLNPFGKGNLEISKADTLKEVPKDIEKQIIKKETPKKVVKQDDSESEN